MNAECTLNLQSQNANVIRAQKRLANAQADANAAESMQIHRAGVRSNRMVVER